MTSHITPNGPGDCNANNGRCPYGNNGKDHYATREEAAAAFEARMGGALGGASVAKSELSTRKKNFILKKDYGDHRHVEISNVMEVMNSNGEIAGLEIHTKNYPLDGTKSLDAALVSAPLVRGGRVELAMDSKRNVVWVRPTIVFDEEKFSQWGEEQGYDMSKESHRAELMSDFGIERRENGDYYTNHPEQRHEVRDGEALRSVVTNVYSNLKNEELGLDD